MSSALKDFTQTTMNKVLQQSEEHFCRSCKNCAAPRWPNVYPSRNKAGLITASSSNTKHYPEDPLRASASTAWESGSKFKTQRCNSKKDTQAVHTLLSILQLNFFFGSRRVIEACFLKTVVFQARKLSSHMPPKDDIVRELCFLLRLFHETVSPFAKDRCIMSAKTGAHLRSVTETLWLV